MSQSTLHSDLPGGPALPPQNIPLAAAALRTGREWLLALDRVLRGEATRPAALREQAIRIPIVGMALLILLLALWYGFCMGMFPGCREEDPSRQRWLACTLKIPALFFLTLCVTFPSLYVVNALVGSRLRLMAVLQLLIAALAVNLAVLASIGPIVAFFSFSTTNNPFMVLLNVLVFAISGVLGMKFLLQTLHRLSMIPPQLPTWATPTSEPPASATATTPTAAPPTATAVEKAIRVAEAIDPAFGPAIPAAPAPPDPAPYPSKPLTWREGAVGQPLDEPSALEALEGHVLGRHVKTVFWCWTLIFSVVGAQMAWVLRPYFGNPGEPFAWFAPRSSNFFEGVWETLSKLL